MGNRVTLRLVVWVVCKLLFGSWLRPYSPVCRLLSPAVGRIVLLARDTDGRPWAARRRQARRGGR